MSTVFLSAFANIRKRGRGLELLGGASSWRRMEDGRFELTLASVPLSKPGRVGRAPAPGEGMLLLYGRDRMEEMRQQHEQARAVGAELAVADFEFEVGEIERDLVDRSTLQGLRFANVRRMKADLQTAILHQFAGYVDMEGGNSNRSMGEAFQIATRPDLFPRLIQDSKNFGGLDVLVIPVADGEDYRIRQLAYVRPRARLVSVRQCSDVVLRLPEWMNVPAVEAMH
ncbi:hypothetical protein ACG04R_16510 [Roseateles sp. BYS78W]|uniref:Uncharacterized protein n=1 Tax=Pelomonas candidula TaxID=3299025 RepID=A0ABW7HEE5_9BURK